MQQPDFLQFVAKFPPVAMPVSLGEDDHYTFSSENEPLPMHLIELFIHPLENGEFDEFTEYVPCFSIEGTEGFVALVYWKASLLTYEYVLVTFNTKGEKIGRRVISRTLVRGEKIRRSVASIDEDWVVFVAEGESSAETDDFDPTTSRTWNYEILSNGEIIEYNVAMN